MTPTYLRRTKTFVEMSLHLPLSASAGLSQPSSPLLLKIPWHLVRPSAARRLSASVLHRDGTTLLQRRQNDTPGSVGRSFRARHLLPAVVPRVQQPDEPSATSLASPREDPEFRYSHGGIQPHPDSLGATQGNVVARQSPKLRLFLDARRLESRWVSNETWIPRMRRQSISALAKSLSGDTPEIYLLIACARIADQDAAAAVYTGGNQLS